MTHTTTYRLTATHRSNGEEAVLVARSTTLEGLVKSIEQNGDTWDSLGWECFTVEDNSLGRGQWSEMLLEDLRGRFKRREISRQTFRELEWNVAR